MVDAQSTSAIEGATAELVGFVDKHKNLLGRYYDRIRLIPFTPDPYTVYLAEPTELVRTQGLKVFDRMMLDEMVNSSVAGYISQVLTDARNQPSGDSAECKAVCDFVTAALDRIEGGLMPSLYELLYGAIYGFGVSPAPYQIIMDGPWLGYVGYKSIRALEPHFLEPVHEFEHGRVTGWNQIDRYSSGPVFFRQDEVIHYVINARYDAARGRSMLLPAHPFWVAKTLLLQMRNMVAEWTIGKLAISHDRSAKDSIDPAKFQSFVAELVSNFLLRAGFGLPAGVKAELLSGATTVTPAVFDSALKHCDQGILRTCGGNWMLSEEPDAGSRALAETQQGGASARFKVPREHFRGIIQHQLVNRLCKINGFRPEHWPKFTLAPAIEGDRQAMVTAAISAISAGALGGEQPGDANWFRERLGMPLIKEGAAQQQAKPAAPAEQPDSGMGEPPESVEVRKTSTYTDGWVWVHDADDAEDFGWQEQPRIPAGGPGGGQFGGHGWVRATSLSSKKGHWIKPGEEGAHMRPIHEQPKYEKPKEEKPKPFEIDAKQHPALAEALGWRGHGEDSGHGHVFEPEITVGKSRKYSGRESTSFSISGKDKQGRDTRFGLHVEEAGDKNNPRSLYRVSTRSWGPSSDTVSRYGTKQEAVNEARRILSGISRVSKNQGFVVKHSSSETFASSDRWWERDLSGAEQPDSGMGEPPEGVEVRKTSTYTDGWVWVHDADDAEDFGWQEQPRIPAGGPGGGQFGGHGWVRATSLSSKKGHWIKPGEEGQHIRPIHEQPKHEPKAPSRRPTLIERREDIPDILQEHTAKVFASPKYDDWKGAEDGHPSAHDVALESGAKLRFDGSTRSWTGDARDLHKASKALDAKADATPNRKQAQRYRNAALAIDTGIRGSINAKIRNDQQKRAEESGHLFPRIHKIYNPLDDNHSDAETFASSDRWWERDLSGAEQRVDFAEIDRGLQGIIDDSREGLNVEWKRSLDALRLQVEGWVSNDRVSAGAMLRKAGDVKMILDGFVAKTVDAGMLAYGFGERQGARELVASGLPNPKRARTVQRFADADPVGPDNPFSLDAYKKLLEAKSFRIASKMGAQVVSRIQLLLENCYENGVSVEDTRKRLASLFDDLAAGHMISPGRADGYDYTSEPIQETTVRTIANTAFNGARQDLYQRNSDWVKGYEISEVGGGHDGQRSHPLSEHLHGLKVAYLLEDGSVNPYAKQFAGAQAYNDRKVDVALTVMDEPIKWSTQAELAKALRWKEKLSPDFV